MTDLMGASRLARAVADLAIRSRSQMPFVVTDGFRADDAAGVVRRVAAALGYGVVDVVAPSHPGITLADVARKASEDLSRISGPAIILVDAARNPHSDILPDVVGGTAHLASEAWSTNGETHLFVLANGHEGVHAAARHVGETLGRHDWADSIPF
jgi:hypothetical protein